MMVLKPKSGYVKELGMSRSSSLRTSTSSSSTQYIQQLESQIDELKDVNSRQEEKIDELQDAKLRQGEKIDELEDVNLRLRVKIDELMDANIRYEIGGKESFCGAT
ncbi:hypothetical protein SO802_004944 [Lithocarpus litseifolius]|uniref:Uncharacterized protein n=1 Tax=Lithocarpus litseifolius TaxID=425828 RepID=A0AAW2DHB9_9ROSI